MDRPTQNRACTRLPPGLPPLCAVVCWFSLLMAGLTTLPCPVQGGVPAVFNVRDYGATGQRADDARPALQKAIDTCAAAGGGTVLVPPGLYTSGTVHLRSHVHIEIAAGATLFASRDPKAFDDGTPPSKAALFVGEDLEDVSFSGRGIVDGQAEYEWRPDDFEQGFDHKTAMQALGKSLMRSFPRGFPKREVFPHLVWLGGCKDIRMSGLTLLHSPSWTITLHACHRAAFQQLYIYTSLKEAVWADGIDVDGSSEVSIADCTIETGDDCVALVSCEFWGKAFVCENVSITNCRLSSASAGIKFSEGNRAGIRNIRVTDTLFNNVNRGVVFLTALGGSISNVILSNLTIHCSRFDWFWAGDGQPFRFRTGRLSEFDRQSPKAGEAPPGSIRNITIRNVVAYAKGSSLFYGHPDNWLEGIRLDNVRLVLATDSTAPFDHARHALDFQRVRDLRLRDVEVLWGQPALPAWQSALNFDEIHGLELDSVACGTAPSSTNAPAVALNQVSGAVLRECRALEGTRVFLGVAGPSTRDIRLETNHLTRAKVACELGKEVPRSAVSGIPAR